MKLIREMTVDGKGRGDVVQHSHPDNGVISFTSDSISATTRFILIDISDTTNYPHTGTTYIHLEDIYILIDTSSSADYELRIGFLENVDDTNGDFYSVYNIKGDKKTGQNKEVYLPVYPNGPRMRSSSLASSTISLNDTNYQTDVNLASTLDPGTADTPSGSGDLVLEVIVNAGDLFVNINMSYHSH